jgi:threonyl-tRNA synthetase
MDQTKLELIRHDAAHVMAMSVQELYPETKVTIGPVIENGFFYDFARETPFTEKDLEKIEKKMKEIVNRDVPVTFKIVTREEAIEIFNKIGENYKLEIINSIP